MFSFCSLVSGSSGNCLLVQNDSTKILIDCGVSGKNAAALLAQTGVDIGEIDAVLVTHEHMDHVSGVGVLSRRHRIPVYANEKTWRAMPSSVGQVPHECVKVIREPQFAVGTLEISSFSTPHDAASPCGYAICSDNKKITVATDTGHIDRQLSSQFKDSDFAFIEANHDVHMLLNGTYPEQLKRRILSDFGHLSNQGAGELAAVLVQNGTRKIMLGHLSNQNNIPHLALQTVSETLQQLGIQPGQDVSLGVAERYLPSPLVTIA